MPTQQHRQNPEDLPVYVLAGGKSQRFGADKALAFLGDKPLIMNALAPFDGLASAVIAVVDRPDRLAPLDLPVVVDAQPFAGPAHGLLTALQHRGNGWLWLMACDVVDIAPAWLAELAAHRAAGDKAVAWRDTRWQPLPSLWHTDALPLVQAALARGQDALWQLLDVVEAHALPLPPGWSQVQRIDTQSDLEAAARSRPAVQHRRVLHVRGAEVRWADDVLAVEAPLQMELTRDGQTRNLGVTLRTPGADGELTLGLAFAEGALRGPADVERLTVAPDAVTVHLTQTAPAPVDVNPRVRVASAACGACGKSELDVLHVESRVASRDFRVPLAILQALPERMRAHQAAFAATGALHAAGLFDAQGTLRDLREDIGRHNALDKLFGAAFQAGTLPLHETILMLSGRAAFELLQKSALAGVPIVASVGAPSSLAVAIAEEAGITLVGFLRHDRANVYAHPHRIDFEGAAGVA